MCLHKKKITKLFLISYIRCCSRSPKQLIIIAFKFYNLLSIQMTMQPKLGKDNILIKISSSGKLVPNASVSTQLINKISDNYPFDKSGSAVLPFQQYLLYRNGPQIAQIDLRPLMAYPQYEHHIHTKTYNQQFPFSDATQSQIVINFLQPNIGMGQGLPLKLTFIDADIVHDTELISKMDPYIRVLIDGAEKWRSKVCQKGDKHPNFKKQSVNLVVKNINDFIVIELWDKDMKQDDFIGGSHIRGYEFMGKGSEIISYPLVYLKQGKADKVLPAGTIRFQAQAPGFI